MTTWLVMCAISFVIGLLIGLNIEVTWTPDE